MFKKNVIYAVLTIMMISLSLSAEEQDTAPVVPEARCNSCAAYLNRENDWVVLKGIDTEEIEFVKAEIRARMTSLELAAIEHTKEDAIPVSMMGAFVTSIHKSMLPEYASDEKYHRALIPVTQAVLAEQAALKKGSLSNRVRSHLPGGKAILIIGGGIVSIGAILTAIKVMVASQKRSQKSQIKEPNTEDGDSKTEEEELLTQEFGKTNNSDELNKIEEELKEELKIKFGNQGVNQGTKEEDTSKDGTQENLDTNNSFVGLNGYMQQATTFVQNNLTQENLEQGINLTVEGVQALQAQGAAITSVVIDGLKSYVPGLFPSGKKNETQTSSQVQSESKIDPLPNTSKTEQQKKLLFDLSESRRFRLEQASSATQTEKKWIQEFDEEPEEAAPILIEIIEEKSGSEFSDILENKISSGLTPQQANSPELPRDTKELKKGRSVEEVQALIKAPVFNDAIKVHYKLQKIEIDRLNALKKLSLDKLDLELKNPHSTLNKFIKIYDVKIQKNNEKINNKKQRKDKKS